MREMNFSIPSANKASVGITAQLYDRRALDCTSTLPLINSLNHLSLLTTSSARIREILTIDGGVERLVYLLKQGRGTEMMDTWKWNLAFHCLFNIGVRGSDARGSSDSRGSETVRTRVVEADIVPVVATILDNYMKALDKMRSIQGHCESSSSSKHRSSSRRNPAKVDSRSGQTAAPALERRRQPPPPIDIRPIDRVPAVHEVDSDAASPEDARPQAVPQRNSGSTTERTMTNTVPSQPHHHHHRHIRTQAGVQPDSQLQEGQTTEPRMRNPPVERLRNPSFEPLSRPRNPLTGRDAFLSPHGNVFHREEVRPTLPITPTTPAFLNRSSGFNRRRSASAPFPSQTTTTQPDASMSGDSSDGDTVVPETAGRIAPLDFQTALAVETLTQAVVLGAVDQAALPAPDVTGDMDADTFNITHRSTDGSIIDPIAPPPNTAMEMSPIAAPFPQADVPPLVQQPHFLQSLAADQTNPSALSSALAAWHPSFPRDEDVIMALQLLAYVSKYPSLRPYFQQTHLVPKLKIDRELYGRDGLEGPDFEETNEHEYCQPNDYNIFPLVEKFTVRHHPAEVIYWAGVVMRNLCRKDKSRGDIRQCAYYKCGKWEEYAREFAKCRRCRQTKYCSKECQKSAWVYHRHWCEPHSEGQKSVPTPHGHEHVCAVATGEGAAV